MTSSYLPLSGHRSVQLRRVPGGGGLRLSNPVSRCLTSAADPPLASGTSAAVQPSSVLMGCVLPCKYYKEDYGKLTNGNYFFNVGFCVSLDLINEMPIKLDNFYFNGVSFLF